MKCLVIGRHQGEFPPEIEVIEQQNINFPASSEDCRAMLEDLASEAEDAGIEAVIFQAIPNQVAMALPDTTFFSLKVGAVVNKPGERLAGQTKVFLEEESDCLELAEVGSDLADAVKFANPRAKIVVLPRQDGRFGRIIKVEVDPPLRFAFSHIEWLNAN